MNATDDERDEGPDLGPCCVCEAVGPEVRNVLMLPHLAPISGRGWGCIECNLPLDGAVAVVCDPCYEGRATLRYACTGWPGKDGRVPFDDLGGHHPHDPNVHRREQP